MLPTHRTLASPLEDRLVCVLYLKLSLGRKLSRAQRVERYFISTNPFTSGYERRGIILPIGLGLRAVVHWMAIISSPLLSVCKTTPFRYL